MKAIKIDVSQQKVYGIELQDGLDPIYQALECDTFSVPYARKNQDALYIDDEGLLKDPEDIKGAFLFSEYPNQPLFGNGLLIGTDPEGESVSVLSTVESIRDRIIFLPPGTELKLIQDELLSKPVQIVNWSYGI